MNRFDQFNIKFNDSVFKGDKIKISKILNKEIIIHGFNLSDSKVFKEKGSGKCLKLQISFNDEKRIIFTSSSGLIEMINQVPKNGFPFTTKIIEEDGRFLFT